MDKKALINSGRLQFSSNDRTDTNFIAQPKINLQSFKSTPDSLKQSFKAFERKTVVGCPCYISGIHIINLFDSFDKNIPFLFFTLHSSED